MSKLLADGAGIPSTNKIAILAALNKVASDFNLDPAAIAAVIHTESKWDTRCVTGSYIGLTQVGPELPRKMGLSKAAFLNLSAPEQIKAYGIWLDHYQFLEKIKSHDMEVAGQSSERQAAVLQAMQFAPNAKAWKNAYARKDFTVRSTRTRQAQFLGDTSIGDMEKYYKGFFARRPPVYSADEALSIVAMAELAEAEGSSVGRIMVVAGEGVYFRASPEGGSDRNILAEFDYGAQLEIRGALDATGYLPAAANVDGVMREGYIHHRYIRELESDKIESFVNAAVAEWVRFNRGEGVEYVEPYSSYIAEYWKLLGYRHLSGRDRGSFWSAAFISFVLSKSGHDRTKLSERHSEYIHQAIQNKVTGTDGDFYGYRIDEIKPEVGDLICQWRETRTTYEIAEMRSSFPSHTDIVIAVRPRAVITLGGNVANARSHGEGVSVETKAFDLDGAGYVDGSRRVFAIMKNRNR